MAVPILGKSPQVNPGISKAQKVSFVFQKRRWSTFFFPPLSLNDIDKNHASKRAAASLILSGGAVCMVVICMMHGCDSYRFFFFLKKEEKTNESKRH